LERKVGRQALEIEFLRRCLQHVEEQRKLQAFTPASRLRVCRKEVNLPTAIRLEGLCRLAHVVGPAITAGRTPRALTNRGLDLRDEIQRIALESPSYGSPRITAELKRCSWEATTSGSIG
jgi:hypothetical protein